MKVIKPNEFSAVDGSFTRASTATYIDGGILKTAAVNEPRFQDGVLLLEGRSTNSILQSQGNDVIYSGGTTPPIVTPGVEHLGVSCSQGVFSAGASLGFNGSRMISRGVTRQTGIPVAASSFISLSRPLVGTERLQYYWFGCPGFFIDADNSDEFVGAFKRVSTSAPIQESGTNSAIVTPVATLLSDLTVYWCRHQYENGTEIPSSYIPTTTTAVTRSPDIVNSLTRASTATYIDGGVLKYAAVNEARYQDGALLVESSNTNLVMYSNTFTDTTWVKLGVSTGGLVTSVDGTTNARTLTATSGGFAVQKTFDDSAVDYTASIWVKGVGSTIGKQYRLGLSGGQSPATILTGNWQRISFSRKSFTAGTSTLDIWNNQGTDFVSGDSIQVCFAQIEFGTSTTSYIPTTAAPVTRAADNLFSGLIYSTATESYSVWSSSTTYALGAKVLYNTHIYESLQNSNTNRNPQTAATFWLDLGADNRHAALDSKIGTVTAAPETLSMIVSSNKVDAITLLNLDAAICTVSVYDLKTYAQIYSNTFGTSGVDVNDWYQYFFFDPLSKRTQVVLSGLGALYPNTLISIKLTGSATSTVKLGALLAGETESLGVTQYAPKVGIVDYSKKETDEFGNVSVVERPFSKRLSADIYFPNYDLNRIQRFLYSIRAKPVVWIASEDPTYEEALVVYGFYKDFSTTIAYPSHSLCNLEIEGLT
jgi:hypothetical protein